MTRVFRRGGVVTSLGWSVVALAAGLWMASALAAETGAGAGAGAAKPVAKAASKRPAAAPGAVQPAGFAIAPAPAWVQPFGLDGLPAIPDAPLQVLLMDDQTRLAPGGSERYTHAVRQINATAGLEPGAQIEITFDPSWQKLTLNQLAIWRDGKRLDRLERKAVKLLQRETQLERQMVDGRMTASIVLEDLRVGDRVEWAFTLVGDNPVFEGKFVDTDWLASSRGPAALVTRRLLTPPGRTVQHLAGVAVETRERDLPDGWHEIVVQRRSVAQARYDGQMPPEDYYADLLEWSEFGSWPEIADWAARQFAPALQEREALAAKADEIRAATADPAQRMTMALDFVQQQIRYFGTEVGASSHRAALPSLVLKQRFGDCKDKSAMLANLLNQLGFEAVPAVVSTVYRTKIAQHLPSPLDFDHAIVAVRQGDGWLWLDGTRSMQTGAASVRGTAGLSPALLARSGETALTALPALRDCLQAESVDTFRFDKLAEPGTLTSVTTYYGDIAENLRMAQASQPVDAFQDALFGELLRAYPKFERDGPAQVEDVAGQNAVRVTLKLRVVDYWRLVQDRVLVGDVSLPLIVSALRVPSMAPRQLATAVALPGEYRQRVRFEFGEPVFKGDSEQPFSESNAFFGLDGAIASHPQSTEYKATLRVTAMRIEAAQWSSYGDALNKAWPRISSHAVLPTVGLDRAEALNKSFEEMKLALTSGRVKATTKVQVDSRYELLLYDAQLASERLPPKLRAQVLVARGEALDHIGNIDGARTAFDDAIALDPQLADAQAAMAVNAMARGDDAQVLSAAARALELSPNDTAPRYTRAQSRYMTGDYAGAAHEFAELLASGSDTERSYRAVWLYLATRAQGEDGKAAVASFQPGGDAPAWPYPVLKLMRGDLTFDAALAQARADKDHSLDRECELYFFAAEKALLDKDRDQARRWFDQSVNTGVVEFIEYGLARREKARLSAG